MPCQYSIRKSDRVVHTKTSGIVTFDEVVAHQDALLADPDFDPAFDHLIDNTSAESFAFTAGEAETIARRRLFSDTSRRAFIADKPAMYGIGRMMSVYHDAVMGREMTAVFRDVESALAWLRQNPRDCASESSLPIPAN